MDLPPHHDILNRTIFIESIEKWARHCYKMILKYWTTFKDILRMIIHVYVRANFSYDN